MKEDKKLLRLKIRVDAAYEALKKSADEAELKENYRKWHEAERVYQKAVADQDITQFYGESDPVGENLIRRDDMVERVKKGRYFKVIVKQVYGSV